MFVRSFNFLPDFLLFAELFLQMCTSDRAERVNTSLLWTAHLMVSKQSKDVSSQRVALLLLQCFAEQPQKCNTATANRFLQKRSII